MTKTLKYRLCFDANVGAQRLYVEDKNYSFWHDLGSLRGEPDAIECQIENKLSHWAEAFCLNVTWVKEA